MDKLVILAGLGTAEVSALVGGLIFIAIMGYLLLGGEKEKEQPKPPKPRR